MDVAAVKFDISDCSGGASCPVESCSWSKGCHSDDSGLRRCCGGTAVPELRWVERLVAIMYGLSATVSEF